jgi:uncharacterized repeat protein (TIGR04138 family)
MAVAVGTTRSRLRYHPQAYVFVTEALRRAQETLGRFKTEEDEESHISGAELLEGARQVALEQFGMMAPVVLAHWGVMATDDIGRIVFEMIDRGELRKTERDQLSDFFGVYSFDDVFRKNYQVDVSQVFTT